MGNMIWKLSALLGVAGLGLLILFQAQQSLQDSPPQDTATADAEKSADSDALAKAHEHADHEHAAEHADHHEDKQVTQVEAIDPAELNPFAVKPATSDSRKKLLPVTQRVSGAETDVPENADAPKPLGDEGEPAIAQTGFDHQPKIIASDKEPERFLRDDKEIAMIEGGSGNDAPAFTNGGGASDAASNPFGPSPNEAFGPPPSAATDAPADKPEPKLAPSTTPEPAAIELKPEPSGDTPAEPTLPPAQTPEPTAEEPATPAPAEPAMSGNPFGAAPPAAPESEAPLEDPAKPAEEAPAEAPEPAPAQPAPEPMPALSPEPMPEAAPAESAPATPTMPADEEQDDEFANPFGALSSGTAPKPEPESKPEPQTTPEPQPEPTPEAAPSAGGNSDPFGGLSDDPFGGPPAAMEERTPPSESESPAPAATPPAMGTPDLPPAESSAPTLGDDDPFGSDPFGSEPSTPAPNMPTEPANPPTEPATPSGPTDPLRGTRPGVHPLADPADHDALAAPAPGPASGMDAPDSPFAGEPRLENRPDPLGGTPDPGSMPPAAQPEPELATPNTDMPDLFAPEVPLAGQPTAQDPPSAAGSPPATGTPQGQPLIGSTGTVPEESPSGPQQAQLTVEKKAPAQASIGVPLVYEIVVTNIGQSPANGVTVSDAVPKGTDLDGTIPRAVIKEDRLTWQLGTIEPRQSSKIRIRVIPREPGSVGSVATVNFVSEVAAKTEIVAPKLALRLTAPDRVTLGQPAEFQFEILNEGSAPAEEVVLRDILPEGFEHADGNDLEYDVGVLPPGAVKRVTLRVATVKAGQYSNRATLTGKGGVTTEAVVNIEVTQEPISLKRQGPKQRFVGRPAVYQNIVRNQSGQLVRSAKVIETIPPGMEFVKASQGGQFNSELRTIAWQIGPLGPGEESTLEVTLTAKNEGYQDSTVRVAAINGGEVQVASTTQVEPMGGRLTSAIQGLADPVIVGERAAFAIHLRNQGTAPATGVMISLAVPASVKFLQAKGGDAFPSTQGVTTVQVVDPIPAGAEHVVEFVVEAASPGNTTIRASIHSAELANPLVEEGQLQVRAARF